MSRIAVVIPARNAAKSIGKSLDALMAGDRLPDEILVLDGQSMDRTGEIARGYGAKVVNNPKRHAAGARQLGVVTSDCPFVAFTDADCVPSKDWLSKIVEHFDADSDLVGVGGKIVLSTPQNSVQAHGARVFETIMNFPETLTVVCSKSMRGSLPGANCAYRRAAVLSAGGFRDEFSNYAEEIDLFWRLVDQKSKLVFDPTILVEHLGYPSNRWALARSSFRYGISSSKLAKYHVGKSRVDLQLYRLLIRSVMHCIKNSRESLDDQLQTISVAFFVAGKVYSSFTERVINF